jgi:SAM-dependent methyltransferase
LRRALKRWPRSQTREAATTAEIRPPKGHEGFFATLDQYFERTLAAHGASARGVDWNSAESQELRFAQLLTVHRTDEPFSLNDYGCGYGALAAFMRERHLDVDYRGFDVSQRMIDEAQRLHGKAGRCVFVMSPSDLDPADYTVASGVFNLKLEVDGGSWRGYVLDTLATMDALSNHGFSFNMLTMYSDQERMRPDLYYGDPAFFFDHCKRHFSRNVALLHDYNLYEFTIVVRK